MSLKPKTIAISVTALLVAAGGAYVFMPDDKQASAPSSEISNSIEATSAPIGSQSQADASAKASKTVDGQSASATPQPIVQPKAPTPAPKTLTRQQLTPPPMTEDEKLQKAAEQESNF